MKRSLLPLLDALALQTAVNAELIYLECKLNEAPLEVEVTLNEREREVIYIYQRSGKFLTTQASYTKDKILFGKEFRSWTIDRTNGRIFFKIDYFGVHENAEGTRKKAEKTKTLF